MFLIFKEFLEKWVYKNMNILTIFAKPAYAIICNPVIDNCRASVAPADYFNAVLPVIISIFFIVGILYFFWHMIFAGLHLIGSDGDPKKFESSKNEMTYSILGLFVIFSIFAILKLVGYILGIEGLDTLSIPWPTI